MPTSLRMVPADASTGSDSRARKPYDVDCHLDDSPAIAGVATEAVVGAAGAAFPTIVVLVVVVVVEVAIAAGPGWCSRPVDQSHFLMSSELAAVTWRPRL